MSDREENRKYPLRRLFGVPPVEVFEPCLRCHKPETNRVIFVVGDANWHRSVLAWTGIDEVTVAALVADRWVEQVYPMHVEVHRIVSDAGHPEWAPLPDTVEGVTQLKGPLTWRMCRRCAAGANLQTINANRLNKLLSDEDDGTEIPCVVLQPDKEKTR